MKNHKAKIRFTKTGVMVLCPLGHLLDYCSTKDWAGSNFEAEVAFRNENDRFERLAKNCQGHGH